MLTHAKLEVGDFLVDSVDELDDEVDQFFLLVSLEVLGRDEERKVVVVADWLLPKDLELVSTEGHEVTKLLGEQSCKFVVLGDSDRNANTVHGCLDQTLLLLILGNVDWVEHQRGVVLELNLWMNLTLNNLRWEVTKVEGGVESLLDSDEICVCNA